MSLKIKIETPVGWVERIPTKKIAYSTKFSSNRETWNHQEPSETQRIMIPTRFGMLGFATPISRNGSLKNGTLCIAKNETVALPLNPTYVDICILFFNPRLIIKLTFPIFSRMVVDVDTDGVNWLSVVYFLELQAWMIWVFPEQSVGSFSLLSGATW